MVRFGIEQAGKAIPMCLLIVTVLQVFLLIEQLQFWFVLQSWM